MLRSWQRDLAVAAMCTHETFTVVRTLGGGDLSDTVTHHGRCLACGAWLAETIWLASRDPKTSVEFRHLTPREIHDCEREAES